MYKIFLSSEHHGTVRRNEIEPGCWIAMTAPSADELQTVASECSIQLEDLRAALDDEERSRIQVEDDYTLIVVDIPVIEERNGKDWYGTIPLGIAVTDSQIITICLEDTPVLNNFMDGRVREFYTYKKTRFILQILYRNATLFLNYLRNIDKRSELLEKKLREDQKNKELLELQELEKSLVYFTTSLKGNELVLEKLFRIDKIKKYPEDEDLLEDVIVENKQAIEMTMIYRDIINGTRELVSSVINNRLNNVMKYLTSITLVMAIPTIISGLYGMNVSGKWMPLSDTPYGFGIICIGTLVICILILLILRKKNML